MEPEAVSRSAERVLNRMLGSDPGAIATLLTTRIPCNERLADDPKVIVDQILTLPIGHYTVGLLGVINGILGEIGAPLVASQFEEQPNGYGHLIGFCVLPSQADNP